MAVQNLTKDFYGRPLFRAFVREDDGAIRHDYAEVEIHGHKYRLYACKDQDTSKVGKLFILVISDSEEPPSCGVKFLVEEDGKAVAQLELFNNDYVLLLDEKELGREIPMLLDAGWQAEF